MFEILNKRVWIAAGVTGAALLGVLLSSSATRAAEDAPAIKVGTFEPALIAQQAGLQAKMQEKMSGLQERAQAAQQSGDQAAMQQLQSEFQQIQKEIVDEFKSSIDKALPKVAEETGVVLIAIEVSYAAPGIESVDVTKEVAAAMGIEFKAPEEAASAPVPAPDDLKNAQ